MDNTLSNFIYYVHIDDRTLAFWDADPSKTVDDYLDSIDPEYFHWMIKSEASNIPKDLILRQVYFQSMETLFALIAAFLQAKDYPIGWMLKYTNRELYSVVDKITNECPLRVSRVPNSTGWLGVVKALLINEQLKWIDHSESIQSNANVLQVLAKEFTDKVFQNEYNSIKHGMRALPSADQLTMFKVSEQNNSEESFIVSSTHGTTFRRAMQITKNKQYSLHNVVKWSTHWKADVISDRIDFILDWIENMRSILRGIRKPLSNQVIQLPNTEFCDSCTKSMAMFPYFGLAGHSDSLKKTRWIHNLDVSSSYEYWPPVNDGDNTRDC